MTKTLNKFIKKYILKNYKKILSNNLKLGGDIDILDTEHSLENKLLKNKIFKKSIISIRHHRTGSRYDLLDNTGYLFCLDFLKGKEKNPIFYNLYNSNSNKLKKIKTKEIKVNLSHFLLIIINLIKYFLWRVKIFLIQKPTIIEIFGVDGAGKSYLSKKILSKFNKINTVKIIHLWKIKNKKKDTLKKPHNKKNYIFIISIIKELYISMRIINLIFQVYVFSKRKSVYVFERSIYDIIIDPNRYRLSHSPFLIKTLYNIFFRKSKKVYLKVSYNLSRIRKNELSKEKYIILNKKLNILFKTKFINSYVQFKKI